MTLTGILIMLVMALIGVPLYIAILTCAIFILVFSLDTQAWLQLSVMFNSIANYNLLAIPLFIYLGQMLGSGGAGRSLVKLFNSFMGHIPGGPAYAIIIACVLIAAMCAHPMAAIAALGPLMIPLMINLGYSETFAAGILIASASLAPLIPPSTMAIIFVIIANPLIQPETIDIASLWAACIIPGLIIALILMIFVFIYSRRGHFKRLPAATWAERWEALKEGWPVTLTPFVIMVPLYTNWANPTEVAVIGCVYVMLISRFFYKGLNWKNMWQANTSTLRVMTSIFLIIMTAMLLSNIFVYAQVPQDVARWITDMGLSWWSFMIVIMLLYIIMGMLLDPSAIILVVVPMLMATTKELGIDPYVFGVFTVIAVVLAGITPPYGLTIFASQSILGKPYHFVVRACLMFIPAFILGMILVAYIPQLSTWLPDLLD